MMEESILNYMNDIKVLCKWKWYTGFFNRMFGSNWG